MSRRGGVLGRASNILKGIAVCAGALTAVSVVATKAIDGFREKKFRELDRIPAKPGEAEVGQIPSEAIELPYHSQGFYERNIKRPQDFACALVATVGLSPIMGATAILVRIKLGKPVIFKQKRPGKDGRIFEIYKFRTMTGERDENGELLPDEVRLTAFGKTLRATSIDELPELFNILKGDMAVIGPRPLLVQYLPLYDAHQACRHLVQPGLSGRAQVSGRNLLSWEEKFDDDVAYVDEVTFAGDWKLIGKTVLKAFKREGINSDASATMEKFAGSDASHGLRVEERTSRKLRVLVLSNKGQGLYLFRKEVFDSLMDSGYEVDICCPEDPYMDFFREDGYKTIDIEFSRRGTNPLDDIKQLNFYKRLIKEEKPDIILSYTAKPNIYGALAADTCHVPIVVNITGLGSAVENPGPLRSIVTMLYNIALRHVKTVFVQNMDNKQFFIDNDIVVDKLKVLPGSGVNLQKHDVLEYPEDEEIRFVFVSRILKDKGIEEYLETAQAIHREHPNTQFFIYGAMEDGYSKIITEYQERGFVRYEGQVDDMRSVYEAASCVVHPSYHEGMSNVLLEACASGRPIITTDVGGCREAVDDGVNGFMVPKQDSKALIKAVENFLSLPIEGRKKMGLAGRKKIEREFNRQIVIDAYEQEVADIRVALKRA